MISVHSSDGPKGHRQHFLAFINSPKFALEPYAETELMKLTGRRGHSRRAAVSLGRFVKTIPPAMLEAGAAQSDLTDGAFSTKAACAVLKHLAPGYPLPAAPFF